MVFPDFFEHCLHWILILPERSSFGICGLDLFLEIEKRHPSYFHRWEIGSFRLPGSILSDGE
ncbi:hypothetical protein DLM76_15225 [Leptospira yasudae]|uniref:Uncharacterized protein n=1 Tax=Leptospira yasudae TaxID=2202201 RepID=A0ABX9M2W8_9LEPT|nr:hypothetical protein DLM77_14175 [Leptospira yasudae]RHX93418.1 hypothetical protein DLM76_15225 [Leptospira yasudae]TGK24782.1 hypothetical protein EHQ05_18000 [Leptospira yasudae]